MSDVEIVTDGGHRRGWSAAEKLRHIWRWLKSKPCSGGCTSTGGQVSEGAAFKPMLLSDRDVAAVLGMTKSSVWSWTKQGKLPQPVRMGSFTRWHRAEIEKLVNQLAY